MPIIVKDFTWTQSESRICINLPLKGTKSTNLDILNSLDFFKISYPPFLFECWFNEKIKDENCSAIINNGIITVQFNKEKEGIWPALFHPDHENKEKLKLVRDEAIVFAGERAKRLSVQKVQEIAASKKDAVKEQMRLEEEERKRIEQTKQAEKNRATEEIEKFKSENHQVLQNPSDIVTNMKKPTQPSISSPSTAESSSPFMNASSKSKGIFDDDNIKSIGEPAEFQAKKSEEKQLPEPRGSGKIQIKFTPRVFPTPSRESQDEKEREWLQKQHEARKMPELPEELGDLSDNEKSLEWLKEKANNYYKQENYQTAIGVYNHAIRLFPKVASLYSNRAACHFKIRNLIKCVEDCTRALDLLTPPVDDNAASRLKAHVRRGTAFCELELYAEGLLDYEAAIKIDPSNEEIKADAQNIRNIIQGTVSVEDE